jgi:hypothetical protein
MLDELERGGVYMNMAWRPARRAVSRPARKQGSGRK